MRHYHQWRGGYAKGDDYWCLGCESRMSQDGIITEGKSTMCDEATKAAIRRARHPRFASRYFVGNGIDIGPGGDSISKHRDKFPNMTTILDYDRPQGDAQTLANIGDASFDWVHSSHCLEHLADPIEALTNWLRVLRPGGYIVCTIPDEDLYEQGVFPSTYNGDHKRTYTLSKRASWSPASVNVFEMLAHFNDRAVPLLVAQHDQGHVYGGERFDQSGGDAEVDVEFVLRKL